MRFGRGLRPKPRWGSSTRSPDTLEAGGVTPLPIHHSTPLALSVLRCSEGEGALLPQIFWSRTVPDCLMLVCHRLYVGGESAMMSLFVSKRRADHVLAATVDGISVCR